MVMKKDILKPFIKPTQDFRDGRLYYGIAVGKEWYLLRSDHTVLTPADGQRLGLRIAPTWIPASDFSSEGFAEYMTGKDVPAAEIYRKVRGYIAERVYLKPDSYASLLALWTMGTYVYRIFRCYPYLWVHGLHARCGKTVLLETLQPIVFNGLLGTGFTGRVLCGLTDSGATLLLDDLHGLCRKPLTAAVLAAGFRSGPVVPAWERGPEGYRLRCYDPYSPKVLVGDKSVWERLWDKSIPIGMARLEPNHRIIRDRGQALAQEHQQRIRDDLYIFGLNYAAEIARWDQETAYPFGLKGMRDRERDLWQPLFGLAHLVDQEMDSHDLVEELAALR